MRKIYDEKKEAQSDFKGQNTHRYMILRYNMLHYYVHVQGFRQTVLCHKF